MKRWLSLFLAGAALSCALAMPASALGLGLTAVKTGPSDTWAATHVELAGRLLLIPEKLRDKDLREDITRTEFAALCLQLYQVMSNQQAPLPQEDPFTDTDDPDVLKAYGLGLVAGVSEDTFDGDALVTREEAAIMLDSVYRACNDVDKRAYLLWILLQQPESRIDWILTNGPEDRVDDDTDLTPRQAVNVLSSAYYRLNGKLGSAGAVPFADDGDISEWARESVYFMERHGIINGVGDNRFDPKANTQAQAALAMAVQMFYKLG